MGYLTSDVGERSLMIRWVEHLKSLLVGWRLGFDRWMLFDVEFIERQLVNA